MQKYSKYIFFAVVVIACVASDQITKQWAEYRLATPNASIGPPQTFDIDVPPEATGRTVREFLGDDLKWTDPEEVDAIARFRTRIDGRTNPSPGTKLKGGEVLTITRRTVTVHPDFFHFKYTRNPGAAFGFLSRDDSALRRPFFIAVSVLAVVVILWIYRKVTWHQKLLMISLCLIVGGALGNLVDRVAYGWVIDFIDWHWYDKYTWPTFNIADAQISLGVALMAIEILIGKGDKKAEEEAIAASKSK
jgi:signal peptidase II